jgi:hypothetical protein
MELDSRLTHKKVRRCMYIKLTDGQVRRCMGRVG